MKTFKFLRDYSETVYTTVEFEVEAETEEEALKMLEDDAFLYFTDEEVTDTRGFEWESDFRKCVLNPFFLEEAAAAPKI